jgi:transposase InsO family protein
MLRLLRLFVGLVCRCFCSRRDLLLENLVLRQQLSVFTQRKQRARLAPFDRLFWVGIKSIWSQWKNSLVMVTPETVVRWHREGFRKYWRWRSRHQVGRRPINRELRELIFQMVSENPTWGAPRIHGELLKLGFEVSERSVSRWMERAPKNPNAGRNWKAFLSNHREAIAAMDFFTVPTLTFSVLYCFFVIAHDRRRILHFHVTRHPNSFWIAQQLREAFPFEHSTKYLIFDHDAKFGNEVLAAVQSVELTSVRTSFRSPWQNGVAERWVGSCRRDLLDHVIAFNERHLQRLLSQYVRYYHEDRTHLGIQKETPGQRKTGVPRGKCQVVSASRLGGLHHRYDLAA